MNVFNDFHLFLISTRKQTFALSIYKPWFYTYYY